MEKKSQHKELRVPSGSSGISYFIKVATERLLIFGDIWTKEEVREKVTRISGETTNTKISKGEHTHDMFKDKQGASMLE